VATFYGADIMDDPSVISGEAALVIVEGELDKLSVEAAGHPWVVSVPEGAPPPPRQDRTGRRAAEPTAADDMTGKFKFMYNNQDRLRAIKKYILAVDDDPAGKCLESEILLCSGDLSRGL
jgi:twinkle protein